MTPWYFWYCHIHRILVEVCLSIPSLYVLLYCIYSSLFCPRIMFALKYIQTVFPLSLIILYINLPVILFTQMFNFNVVGILFYPFNLYTLLRVKTQLPMDWVYILTVNNFTFFTSLFNCTSFLYNCIDLDICINVYLFFIILWYYLLNICYYLLVTKIYCLLVFFP